MCCTVRVIKIVMKKIWYEKENILTHPHSNRRRIGHEPKTVENEAEFGHDYGLEINFSVKF